MYAGAREVDDVGSTRAVDVGEADATAVEEIRPLEPRRAVHRHLRAEAAVALVRPVAHLAVADADQIGQAVARHVRDEDRLGAVREDQPRSFLLVERLPRVLGRTVAGLAERSVPAERVRFGDQEVGQAVAGQIHELQVRISPVDVGQRRKRRERLPVL